MQLPGVCVRGRWRVEDGCGRGDGGGGRGNDKEAFLSKTTIDLITVTVTTIDRVRHDKNTYISDENTLIGVSLFPFIYLVS